MIRLQRYRSALKSVVPIVFHTFFSQEPPFCASDEIIEELEVGYFLTDSDLKRVAQEAWDSGVDAYRQYSEYGVRLTFDEYWAEQQARKGEG